ncbi:MAG TPA: diacylglycerol kinase [Algoriphagus sp.]|jgi:diacylglycerol kinase family enzyme|uniref:diacylglycerol/lipid kinase family protein n=2 Tax=Algoriphagus TaxID=246875 RepID=UPI000C5E41BD|nr:MULTISPECIES: diacylglycerol kinase family protein [unclassified Algoriphagus]MAL15171.1 diacylglycerol kinase [Algoriphagus sp.]MAN85468.1 diacylglycerol kinase [Algoriphagus sp.]QYH37799.1 diacylglycerol kinase [Algoriphagus sp. NBT04N3]HAD50967.1 diacylglycerol kinase [Algoriphagus sp.]HAH38352.1 diacylglycerol kinase [Algoriphagus sp.]|tara:strand:+ start:236 stop:1105 length:870 start_codon:yes stop_codon:yes gene_type:complete
MDQKALLIFNPKSGSDPISLEELTERIAMHLNQAELSVFQTTGENDADKIRQEINKHNPSLLLVAGGDGTVKLVAESLQTQLPIAILPLGSANGLAKCLGIDLLEDGLEALRQLKVKNVDGIDINGELCLHLADFGFNANLIEKFEEQGTRGMMGYIKSSFSQIFETEPYRYLIKTKDENWEVSTRMLLIANGDRFGTGAIVNPGGSLDDGKFELITLDVERLEHLFEVGKSLVSGETPIGESMKIWKLDSCKIENLDQVNFQIDGELKGQPEEITVHIQAARFQFVVK